MSAGIYTDTDATYKAAAMTEIVTFGPKNIASGGIADENVLRCRTEMQGDGTARFILNGAQLASVAIDSPDVVIDVDIQRVGTNAAIVRVWKTTQGGSPVFLSRSGVNGLAWNQQQAFEVRLIGTASPATVGQMFAGIAK